MNLILVAMTVAAASTARLDNAYLPPTGSAGSYGKSYPSPGGYSGSDGSQPFIPIISYNNQPNTGDGSYSFSYETGNGIKAQEQGYLKQDVPEGPGEAVQGSYSYTAPDGQVITVTYTADENGFVPQGAHLPTPPPIPPEILKSLQQNAATGGDSGDGGYQGSGGYSGGFGGGGGYPGGSGGYSYPQPGK